MGTVDFLQFDQKQQKKQVPHRQYKVLSYAD